MYVLKLLKNPTRSQCLIFTQVKLMFSPFFSYLKAYNTVETELDLRRNFNVSKRRRLLLVVVTPLILRYGLVPVKH